MRKIFLLTALICCIAFGASAQDNKTPQNVPAAPSAPQLPPYQKNPTIPEFRMMLMDSVTFINSKSIAKGQNTLFVIFSPDCKHCKAFTKELLENIDLLKSKNVQIYLVTPIRNLGALRSYYSEYNFQNYPIIKAVAQDTEFFVMDFFAIRSFPSAILYDEQKKLIIELGNPTIKDLLANLR